MQKIHGFTSPDALIALGNLLKEIDFLRELDLAWELDRSRYVVGNLNRRLSRLTMDEICDGDTITDGLEFINRLHDEYGWKRTSSPGRGPWWILEAYTEIDGTRISFQCHRDYRDGRLDGEEVAAPFFAPPMPGLPLQGPLSAERKAEIQEWKRKCHNDEW